MSKKTVATIVNSGNNYVIGVKRNQKDLFNKVEAITSDSKNISSSYIELIANKGRGELRHVMVSDCLETISKDWIGLKQLIKVRRITIIKQQRREETAYFITSKQSNALFYCEGIRTHWAIENTFHWVKDVTFHEDASRIRTMQAPQNISTIKNIAINIFRTNNQNNMAKAQRLVANDIAQLKTLLN